MCFALASGPWLGCGDDDGAPAPDPLLAARGVLRDTEGRQILLRGINARVEGIFDVTFDDGRTALEPIPPFDGEDCRFLAEELGYNHLRLPINWSGLEPVRGEYDREYLQRVIALVDDCGVHGIYTLVDLHQDAFSKHIGEDGAPLWAIVPPPTDLLEGPLHDLDERRTSGQVLAAFESFFDNTDGVQDAYADLAAWLAAELDGHPWVVGLELMNEPVLLFEEEPLALFHENVGQAARLAAPELTLFFEPNSLRNMVDDWPVEYPFPLADAVYSPHIYTEVFLNGWESEDVTKIRTSVENAVAEAAAHDAPLYVGEFGNDPKSDRGRTWIDETLKLFDLHLVSSAIWLYEEWSQGSWGCYDALPEPNPGRGPLREEVIDLLARPYPQAIDGTLRSFAYDPTTRTLTVSITDAGEGEHLLAAPERVYPSGVTATCDGAVVETTAGPGRVALRCTGQTLTLRPAGG
ncbi:MAG: cellulase family glycosylhydrolase [bacterium]